MCRKIPERIYCFKEWEIAKTHDLVVLCETCASWDPEFEKIIINCSDLTIYASEVRYPNVLEIEDYHMKSAIKDAVRIKEFVLTKVDGFL